MPDPDSGKRRFDELAYVAELRARLEAVQPVDQQFLQTLAKQRRDMALAFLSAQGILPENQFKAGAPAEAELNPRGQVRTGLEIIAIE